MAIAGGACSAYTVTLRPDGTLDTRSRTALRSMCTDLDSEPGEAVKKLRNGEALTVAGSDMVKLRQLLSSSGRAIAILGLTSPNECATL